MLKNSRFYVLFYIPGVDGADGAAKTKQFFLTYFFSHATFKKNTISIDDLFPYIDVLHDFGLIKRHRV